MTPSSDDDEGDGSGRGFRRADVLAALGAALVSLGVAIWSLRLWDWTVGTPLMMSGDSTFVGMQLRDIADQGWYWNNPDLGYPFSQNGAMFPELNVVHVLLVKVLGLFAASPFTPGVVYFVLCFPLAAMSMYALARSQGLSPWAGFVAGVLFANVPGHQERFGHLWLAAYWTVPLGMWVVLEVMRGRPLSSARPGSGRLGRWLGVRTWLTLGALTAVGLSGVYYVAFTLVLLLVATVAARWRAGTARGWAPGLLSIAYLGAVLLVPLLTARLGARGEVVTGQLPTARSFAESEIFAGKFMDLALPWAGPSARPARPPDLRLQRGDARDRRDLGAGGRGPGRLARPRWWSRCARSSPTRRPMPTCAGGPRCHWWPPPSTPSVVRHRSSRCSSRRRFAPGLVSPCTSCCSACWQSGGG